MTDTNASKQVWDVVIVGAGPAGSAAAMVLGRCHRKVLLIDDGNPRNAKSQGIHNYLTRDGILPTDFLSTSHKELEKYNIVCIKARAIGVTRFAGGFEVADSNKQKFNCRRLLIATGVKDTIPDIPGMQELWGRAVFHCPFCDGWEVTGKTVGLYSNKFNGYGMALALRQLTDKVILFTDTARYLKASQRAYLQTKNIIVVSSKISHLTIDNDILTCVHLQNGKDVACDTVFINNGTSYNNELILQLGIRCSKKGGVIINRRQECSVPGVYVAGDAALDMQFVIVAAAEGVKAAVALHDDLLRIDNHLPSLYKTQRDENKENTTL